MQKVIVEKDLEKARILCEEIIGESYHSIERMGGLTSSLSLKYLCKYYHMYLSSGSMSASAISSAVISSVLYVQ